MSACSAPCRCVSNANQYAKSSNIIFQAQYNANSRMVQKEMPYTHEVRHMQYSRLACLLARLVSPKIVVSRNVVVLSLPEGYVIVILGVPPYDRLIDSLAIIS